MERGQLRCRRRRVLGGSILGCTVVWYDDIEDGFNCSTYHRHGVIGEYGADQADLEVAVQGLINRLEFVATLA